MKITLDLNKKQFERLLKVVYLGEWMINANRDHPLQAYEEIQDLIFSLAGKFGLEKYYTHEPRDGNHYFPSRLFEQGDVDNFHEEYDEQTFVDELVEKLVERDIIRKYGANEVKKMDIREYWEKLEEFEEYWANEVNNRGIERLEVMKDNIFVFDKK